MITPPFLKKGDTIAVFSPAAALHDATIVEKAADTLRDWGLDVIISPNCHTRDGYYSGNKKSRTADMFSLLADKKVKAILCSYGGYGCVHIVEDFAVAIQKNPKWIIGMSDCSALHAAAINAGVMSLHSPQCRHIGIDAGHEYIKKIKDILFGELPCYKTDGNNLNILGKATGRLVGGNLSVLCGLLRTPYDIFADKTILFIEDLNEPFYKLERMMYNLKLAGILNNISALIVGQFTNIGGCDAFAESVYEMIHRIVADCNIPVCFNFPVGHTRPNFPLIEGADATLTITESDVTLTFLAESTTTTCI